MKDAIVLIIVLLIMSCVTTGTCNNITDLKVKWTFKTNGSIRSAATVSGDVIYIGSADGFLYALGKEKGDLKWSFQSNGAIAGTSAVNNELVIFSSRDNFVYAVSKENGKLVWKFQMQQVLSGYTEWEYFTSAPVIAGTKVLVGSGDGHLYALDSQTGKLIWKFKTGGRIRSTAKVHDEIIYQPSNDGIVYVLSSSNGKLLWSFKTEGASLDKSQGFDRTCIFSTPGLKDNLLIFGSRDGNLYAVDVLTRQKKWNFNYGSTWAMSTAIDNSTAYVGWSTNRKFCAIDIATGSERWQYEFGSVVYSTAYIRGEQVIVGSADGKVYILNKETGTKDAEYYVGSEIHASPVADETTVYVGSDNGYFYALEQGKDVYKAVYQPMPDGQTNYPVIDAAITPYFKERGFQQLDSAKLYQFISDRIRDKALSVVVFAYDAVPPNIVGEHPENGMIRKYLESGGKILWFGGVPNLFGFDAKGKFQRGRDLTVATRLLDVDFVSPEESGNYYSRSTQQGLNWGLPAWLKTTHSSVAAEKVIPFTIDEHNRVSAWMKKFNDRPGSGFISCRTWAWDLPMNTDDLNLAHHLALHELQ